MDRFDGDITKFRVWKFDLGIALGQVDKPLSDELDRWFRAVNEDEPAVKWDPVKHNSGMLDLRIWQKFSSELYAVLVSLTGGKLTV